jgi:hypothetical protein
MLLLKKLLNKFNGLYYPQEYLCLAKEKFEQALNVYLVNNNRVVKEITGQYLFAGYSPLVFTFHSSTADHLDLRDTIEVVLSDQSLPPNEFLKKKDAIARLSLKMIRKQSAGETEIAYYEGMHGSHHFISSFHQSVNGLYNRLYNKKPGNVFLNGNLYKQVQIAYSVPCIISLITVENNGLYNLFPTDLHGPAGEQYYVSSLRHEGKACRQVESAGRIVISNIHCDTYKTVYSLGKNHMQDPRAKNDLPFGETRSAVFQLPLPQAVLYYRELELIESLKHGIHQFFFYKTVSTHSVNDEPATLAHIHNVYATWRHNKGLSGNYLLR